MTEGSPTRSEYDSTSDEEPEREARRQPAEKSPRGRKKFADMRLVPGSELLLETKIPFGGLLRVRVMGSSMTIHQDDADILLG